MLGGGQQCKHVTKHASKHCTAISDDMGRHANWCAHGVTFHRNNTVRDQLADLARQGAATVQKEPRTSVQIRDDLNISKGGDRPTPTHIHTHRPLTYTFYMQLCGRHG